MQFGEMLATVRVVAMALISCFAIGLPVVVAGSSLCNRRLNPESCWFYAPLVGAGFVILICQNLLYADFPISQSAVVIWVIAAVGWLWLLTSASRRSLLNPVPWAALGLGAMVYLIQAGGLLSLGASNYYGYGWGDMLNYVSLAQFLAEFPFHSNVSAEGYLQAAQFFKSDRIGQSVLHSFLMVSSGTDAQQSFGATILLSPYLMFFAFLTVARRFAVPFPIACLAALAGALSPVVATLHLECFFSQAMCLPFLVLLPGAIGHVVDAPSWRSALLAGLLVAVISAIYTEMLPIVLAIAIVCGIAKDASGLKILRTRFPWRLPGDGADARPAVPALLWLVVVLAVGLLANPGYAQTALGIVYRTTTGIVLAEIYPWAFKFEGVVRLWLGNQAQRPPETIFDIIVVVTVLALVGNLVSLWFCGKRVYSTFFLALLALMLIPLGPLLAGGASKYPYQFYKLLLMVTPFHAFWLVIAAALLQSYSIVARNYAYAVAVILAAVNGWLTLGIARASAEIATVATSHRGGANLLISPEFAELRGFLDTVKDRDVFTLWYDNELYAGAYRSGWINYFARRNRVRSLITTTFGQADAVDQRFSKQNLEEVSSAIIVTWKPLDELKSRLLLSNSLVSVYQTEMQGEMRSLIEASRITHLRRLKLEANREFDSASWYPIWVAGEPGNASLLTMKFGEFIQFRYDHWGSQAVYLSPGGRCTGQAMSLTVRLMQPEKRLELECNGAVVQADLPSPFTRLESRGSPHFGWNAGFTSLEGKYPLAENFPGAVVEIP